MKTVRLVALMSAAFFTGCPGSGPAVLEWDYTGGPFGQNVVTLLPDQKLPGQIFAALSTGDLFVTRDEGNSWKIVSTVRKWDRIYQLVQDPENGDILYAATEQGLFVSRNRGSEWTRIGPAAGDALPCRVLTIDPWKTSNLYLGTGANGIYTSADGGATWKLRDNRGDSLFATAEVYQIAVDATKPDVVVAALAGMGIVKSTDAGETWRRLTSEVSLRSPTITHLLLHPKSSDLLLYGTDAGTLMRTTDGGESWSIAKKDVEAWAILTLGTDPLNPDVVYAGTENGIIRSSDFGATWTKPSASISAVPTSLALSAPKGQLLLFAYGAGLGVQVSRDNGITWRQADDNLGGATISLVTSDPTGTAVYAVAGSALLRLDQQGHSWTPASAGLSGGDITSVAFDADNSSIMYATSTSGAFKSTSAGREWTPIARNVRMQPRFIEAHPSIKTRMIASGLQGAFVSTDRGNSWILTKPLGNKFSFHSLTFTPKNAGIIHAATFTQGVLVTNDGGLRWEPARYGLTSDSITAVTLDDQEGLTYFAWSPRGECFRSTNNGLEWTRYSPPWTVGGKVHVAFDKQDPSSVVAIVNGEDIYYSPTGGASWFHLVERGPRFDVLSTHWNAHSGFLYVGTREKGVYQILLGPIIKDIVGD